jgi:phage terminase large subunit-like protein
MGRVQRASDLVGAPQSATAGFHLTVKQEQAQAILAGPATHVCGVGGARSGKTFLFTRAVTSRALMAPGSRHAILRFRYNAVKSAVLLDTFPAVMRRCFPEVPYEVIRQDGYVLMPNRAEIWFGGLDEKDRIEKILGMEFCTIFLNECSQIAYASVAVVRTRLAQKLAGVRLKMYYDLNPPGSGHWTNRLFFQKLEPRSLQALPDPERYAGFFMNPDDNRENLPDGYIEQELDTLPERQRKRFRLGEYQPEVEGALWSMEGIERSRCEPDEVPQLQRVVVAVDPSGTAGKEKQTDQRKNDDVGIVVAGHGADNRVYLLEDLSCNKPPEGWAKDVVRAYHKHKADRVVAEANFGGDMVRAVIQSVDAQVPVTMVVASRGKAVRAEPVSVLYEEKQDKVRHVGHFPRLEEQLLNFSTVGYEGEKSPDRADAWVWAVTDLIIAGSAGAWIEYYRQQAAPDSRKTQAAADAQAKSDVRPWQAPVQPAAEGGDLIEFYKRTYDEAMGIKPPTCKRCGKPMGATRVSDGVDVWHPECRPHH